MSWGVIGSLARMHGIPILQASPQEIKRKVAGAKNASKADVRGALNKLYPGIAWPSTKKAKEDTGDALAAVVTCLDDQVVQMALRLQQQRQQGA
jgi:Holliday junction resolvasome RuvABC endonuclease subunit